MNAIRVSCGRTVSQDAVRARLTQILGHLPGINIIKRDGYDAAKVECQTEAGAKEALQLLTTQIPEWHAQTIVARPIAQHGKKGQGAAAAAAADPTTPSPSSPIRPLSPSAANAVAPWRNVPYPEQLVRKKAEFISAVKQWRGKLRTAEKNKTTEMGIAASGGGKLINSWLDGILDTPIEIVPSPVIMGYRNKIDFTIGLDNTHNIVVGFRVGSFGDTQLVVESPEACGATVSDIAMEFAAFLTPWIRNKSQLKIFDGDSLVGFWRGVTVRHSVTSREVMIVFRLSTTCGEEGKKELQDVAREIMAHPFSANMGSHVTCVLVQWWDGKSPQPAVDTPFELVAGERAYIRETLVGMELHVSPGAFFQVNTPCADVLFGLVRKELGATASNVTLLDICCGTGVIGLLMANVVNRVVGVELSPHAVNDARANAVLTGLAHKARFICAKAEHAIPRLLGKKRVSNKPCSSPLDEEELIKAIDESDVPGGVEFVAIVDPPRPGLLRDAVMALRNADLVSRIIYVTCNPCGSFLEDARVLCQSATNNLSGQPFKMTSMCLVDQFPHTEHLEGLFVFERDQTRPAHQTHAKRKMMKAKREMEDASAGGDGGKRVKVDGGV